MIMLKYNEINKNRTSSFPNFFYLIPTPLGILLYREATSVIIFGWRGYSFSNLFFFFNETILPF